MGLFSKLFGGDAADNNDNIRRADESSDDFAKRIGGRTKPEDITLENIDKHNAAAAIDAGLISADEYISLRREQHKREYDKRQDQINTRKEQSNDAVPMSDWYMGDDGYMYRNYSDGSSRRR